MLTQEGRQSAPPPNADDHVRAMITVERLSSSTSPYRVGPEAAGLLGTMPGVSEIVVEHQDLQRATISYTWKDPGTHSESMDAVLLKQAMRLIR